MFIKGDCLETLRTLQSKSVDFIYFNPPFGITRQPWDEKLDWKNIFTELFRIVKEKGTIAIHCSVPFNYELIRSAHSPPNYSWYWNKMNTTTPLLAKRQPMRCVEEILIWTTGKYNPQRIGTEIRTFTSSGLTKYVDEGYCKPQEKQTVVGHYQNHLINMRKHVRGFATRPDELIELLIKSYTDIDDLILDPTCYKGLSGDIAQRLGRRWIGIDKYFEPDINSLPLSSLPPVN